MTYKKPIIFSTSMVRAILDGKKCQTRRVIKPQPNWPEGKYRYDGVIEGLHAVELMDGEKPTEKYFPVSRPPFAPSDLLWVRETFCHHADAEKPWYGYKANGGDERDLDYRWKPSIHMPREASRITLEVTGVRAERLQDISEADAKAEGIKSYFLHKEHGGEWHESNGAFIGVNRTHSSRRLAFTEIWEQLHAKNPMCSWRDNPYVWVIAFKEVPR